jgi:SAM-dependent methyltransferase
MGTMSNPHVVREEYASEASHDTRASAFQSYLKGENAKSVALEIVVALKPKRVLDVGCGDGGFIRDVAARTGAKVHAMDISPRMVELASAKGAAATVGDIERLPFADGEFDCVVANWMLYHVEDLGRGLSEVARVLRDDGAFVASTVGEENLAAVWDLVGHTGTRDYSFTRENGGDRLRLHFDEVEMRPVDAEMVFPDREAVVRYAAATIANPGLGDRVPEFEGPFPAMSRQGVFVSRRPQARQ